MTEFVYSHRRDEISSGFVGTAICWIAGLLICAAAVAYSVSGSLRTYLVALVLLLLGACVCGWAQSATHRTRLRLSALFLSCVFAFIVAEVVLRMLTPYPINFASNVVPHTDLGYTLDPAADGTDSAGFRNPAIPEQFDIIAIGDSHTQGFGVTDEQSWPAVLSQQTGRNVYSMAVGGYGPQHYAKLVQAAIAQRPRKIIVGLYTGNDIDDVQRGFVQRHSEVEVDNRFRHAARYQCAVGCLLHQWIDRSVLGRSPGMEIAHPKNPTFVSNDRLNYLKESLDTANKTVAESLQATLGKITEMQNSCQAAEIEFAILMIPSREFVYRQSMNAQLAASFPSLIEAAEREGRIRQALQSEFARQGIVFADTASSLTTALDQSAGVYANFDDGHPRQAGYAVYAEVASHLVQP